MPGDMQKEEEEEAADAAASPVSPADYADVLLGLPSGGFTMAMQCWDVAVTVNGHFLLAAREHGLIECDAVGRTLSSWTPAQGNRKDESVQAVDELGDGRVAVGLIRAQTVLLLHRSDAGRGDRWLVDQQVTGLQGWPWRLSAYGDLMAVAEGSARHHLVLVGVPDGRIRLRREPGYKIYCVLATARAVLVVSHGRVQLNANIDDEQLHVVDCYSHSGQSLWRQLSDDQVSDVCVTPTDHVLYVAVEDSDRVAAISAENGRLLVDVLTSGTHGLRKPLRMSLGAGPTPVLAVLSGNAKTVTIYPVGGVR